MQRVQGFGGFFFRAKDPEGLAKWYHDHLGINPAPKNMEMPPWVTESGVTVFGPFAADTDYFAADKTFMLNFRVADLDAMIAQLKSADIEVSPAKPWFPFEQLDVSVEAYDRHTGQKLFENRISSCFSTWLRTAGSPVATQPNSARFIRSRRAGSWLD